MDQVGVITGRQYKLFEYYGDPQAEQCPSLGSLLDPQGSFFYFRGRIIPKFKFLI